jgi:hypothetical protein
MPVVTCPNCGTSLEAPESILGRQVTCGKCRCLFVANTLESPSQRRSAGLAEPKTQAPQPRQEAEPQPPDSQPSDQFQSPERPQTMPPLPPPSFLPPPVPGYYGGQYLPGSGYAVAALVLGITSLVTCSCYGVPAIICGPLAMSFASKAMRDIQCGLVSPSSAGLAKAGKICGLIGLLLGIGYIILLAVIIAAGAGVH